MYLFKLKHPAIRPNSVPTGRSKVVSVPVLLCLCVCGFIVCVCVVLTFSSSHLVLVALEGCASLLWHFLGIFTYIWASKRQNVQNGMCAQRRQIRTGWSESSLSAWRKLGSLATHWALSEDSDQTGWMPRLIWVLDGRICHFVGCHALAHLLHLYKL